jgi:hypothetical protein
VTDKSSEVERHAKLAKQQDEGVAAERILTDELFNKVIKGMKMGNLQNWREADPSNTVEMVKYHALDSFLENFKDAFQDIAIRGENARKTMSRLANEKKAA